MPLFRALKEKSGFNFFIAGDTCDVILLVYGISKVVKHQTLSISIVSKVCIFLSCCFAEKCQGYAAGPCAY